MLGEITIEVVTGEVNVEVTIGAVEVINEVICGWLTIKLWLIMGADEDETGGTDEAAA